MNNNRICLFGEVLFDVFPDGSQILGGAPFNVAWHLQAFAEQPCFISRVGSDLLGDQIAAAMQTWHMDLSELQRDHDYPSGVVKVLIEQGEPSYQILPEQAYDYINAAQLHSTSFNGILYHGSLALRNLVSRQALTAIKENHQGLLFIDVNLREPWWQKIDVLELLKGADWVKMNQDEFQVLHVVGNDLKQSMRDFQLQYGLGCLLVTCGRHGAIAVDAAGEFHSVQPVADLSITDSVGAGDAFAAVMLLGIQHNWPLPKIMARAQTFASALLAKRGATVQDKAFYQYFLHSWSLS
ncbi:MAG: PfkB family carbohydrate kinase [Methylococcales bacterium]